MGIFSRLFGTRWSIYFVKDAEPRYVMHENSVVRMLGYVMVRFHRAGNPRPPWSIHARHNASEQSFPLTREHFTQDGTNLSPALEKTLSQLDARYDYVRGREPLVIDLASNTKIPIESVRSIDDLFQAARAGKKKQSLMSVLSEVFDDPRDA